MNLNTFDIPDRELDDYINWLSDEYDPSEFYCETASKDYEDIIMSDFYREL